MNEDIRVTSVSFSSVCSWVKVTKMSRVWLKKLVHTFLDFLTISTGYVESSGNWGIKDAVLALKRVKVESVILAPLLVCKPS